MYVYIYRYLKYNFIYTLTRYSTINKTLLLPLHSSIASRESDYNKKKKYPLNTSNFPRGRRSWKTVVKQLLEFIYAITVVVIWVFYAILQMQITCWWRGG